MKKIRSHQVSDEIKEIISVPWAVCIRFKNVFEDNQCALEDFLISKLADPKANLSNTKFDECTSIRVLRNIIGRCCIFGKPIEWITVKDIITGKPGLRVGGVPKAPRVIQVVLRFLESQGLIIRKETGKGLREVFYGPNMSLILESILAQCLLTPPIGVSAENHDERINLALAELEKYRERLEVLRNVEAKTADELVEGVRMGVENLAVNAGVSTDVGTKIASEGVDGMKEKGGSDLGKIAKEVTAASREKQVSEEKRAGELSFEGVDGPANALCFFYSVVRAEFPDYPIAVSQKKARGQMKHFLTELRASHYTDDGIREFLTDLVCKWRHIAGTSLFYEYADKTTGQMRQGVMAVPRVPDWPFFFPARQKLLHHFTTSVRVATKPSSGPSGTGVVPTGVAARVWEREQARKNQGRGES